MEKTKINYQETREVGKKIIGYAEGYEQIYSQDLYNSFRNNLNSCFKGDDATVAIGQLDALRDDFVAMKNVIWQYGNQLIKAADAYEEDMGASKHLAGSLTGNRK